MTAPDAQPPAVWWSPAEGVMVDGQAQGYVWEDDLPADAVRLVPGPASAALDGTPRPTRDALIAAIDEAMSGETVWTRAYGNVQIAADSGDLADAVLALLASTPTRTEETDDVRDR